MSRQRRSVPSPRWKSGVMNLRAAPRFVCGNPSPDRKCRICRIISRASFPIAGAESFEQQEIQTSDGVLYVQFAEERFDFEVEQVRSTEVSVEKNSLFPKRPENEAGGHGWEHLCHPRQSISRLLKENGQPHQAKEMM